MKIIRFEPGDATAYFVLYHRLDEAERNAMQGLSAGAFLYGFATASQPTPVVPFQGHGYLDFSYYLEKMYVKDLMTQYTLAAGYKVLEYLLYGMRDFGGVPETYENITENWYGHWPLLVAPLLNQ